MALVLIRDPKGRGNAHPDGTLCEDDDCKEEGHGSAVVLDFTAKGHGMVFTLWRPVATSGEKHERVLIQQINGRVSHPSESPIRRMEWADREMVDAVFEHCPDLKVQADPATDRGGFIAEMTSLAESYAPTRKNGGAKRDPNAPPKPRVSDYRGKSAQQKAEAGAEMRKGADARVGEYASAVYDQKVAEHKAAGKTDTLAATYAGRTRDAILRKGVIPDPPADQEATV